VGSGQNASLATLANREALEELASSFETFSPTVGIAVEEPAETLLVDISATVACFGGEQAILEQVLRECARRRLVVRAAVGHTIGAAWALAHFGEPSAGASHGDGEIKRRVMLVGVCEERSAAMLDALPLASLRLTEETLALLDALGLRQIGDVTALPRESLAARFGPELALRLDQMFGRAEETIDAHAPPAEYIAERLLEYPVRGRDMLNAVLQPLVADVSNQLAARRYGALSMMCRLMLEAAPAVEFTVSLFAPTAEERHVWQLVELQLERLRLCAPIVGASLTVVAAAPLEHRQQQLFDEPEPRDDPRPLAALIERLSNRLGRAAVLKPKRVADPQPEYAVRFEPLVGRSLRRRLLPAKKPRRPNSLLKKGTDPLRHDEFRGENAHQRVCPLFQQAAKQPPREEAADVSTSHERANECGCLARPLRLLSPPAMLEVLSIVPDGPPLRFRFRGEDHEVARFWGPERIETGWWRHRPVWRDYYRVETCTGAWFWLFRRRDDGRWRLHGEFE
jgi:protein ImuB